MGKASKSWLYNFSCLSLKKSLESSFRTGDHLGCIPAVQQGLCFSELLSHKCATEAIKGWEAGVWPPWKHSLSVRFLCSEMAVATLFFSFLQVVGNYTGGIQAVLPWNFLSCSVSALQHRAAAQKGQWFRKASPGLFGEMSAAVDKTAALQVSNEPPVQ